MLDTNIILQIGVENLIGWESVSVNRAIDALADTFEFQMVDAWNGDDTPLRPDRECKIFAEMITANGVKVKEQVLGGWIDKVNISVDTGSILIGVNGRSKTGDLVDCSAEYLPSNSWKNVQMTTIFRDLLSEYGVDLDFVSAIASGKDANLTLTLNLGESIFEVIDRECKKRGIIPVTNPYGNLELITTGDRSSRDKLVLGQNIKSASIFFEYSNRFSTYKVRGQKSGGGDSWGKKSTTQISGEATDSVFGSRNRLKIITLDGEGTNKDAQNTAGWEGQIRAGRAGKLSVETPGWFQSDNTLWEVGTLVYCSIPPLRVEESLLISSVNFSQGSGGTATTLDLVNADTYLANPERVVKITSKSQKKGFGYGW